MSFFVYDQTNRSQFDPPAQRQLDTLEQKFGKVEIREITTSKEWCVRIDIKLDDDDGYPLAALGDTPYEAASRLIRISQTR